MEQNDKELQELMVVRAPLMLRLIQNGVKA
jgi:hypothetical protein